MTFVSHLVPLTGEQILSLQTVGATETATGSCLIVSYKNGASNEPADELFCTYEVTRADAGPSIKATPTGFSITIKSQELAASLVTTPQCVGGCDYEIEDVDTIHQITVLPESEVDRSAVVLQICQIGSK